MMYRTDSMASGEFETYYFEKNLQGDVIAVYNESGTVMIEYVYDAWGNAKYTYKNGADSTGARFNPFRYRGYYYDSDLGFYYLNSRYYDSVTGRFLNADGYLNGNGDIIGYNMFAYCSNNPVMKVDRSGKGFLSDIWEAIKNYFINSYDAIVSSVEVEAGLGYGFSFNSNDVGVQYYRDFYIAINDGDLEGGSMAEKGWSMSCIGNNSTAKHCTDKWSEASYYHFCSHCFSGEYSLGTMLSCPEAQTKSFTFGPLTISNDGDIVVGVSTSFHAILGGHASAGFNISEYIRCKFGLEE